MTLAELIARWTGTEGGAERANYQMFLSEFAQAMGLPAPQPKGAGLGAYEFEAPVRSEAALGRKGTGRIDLYKRGCFILEAKQSQLKPGETAPAEPAEAAPKVIYDLFGHAIGAEAPARAMPRYDRLMADARLQAERYALALPGDHTAPPFLIVADIGRAFELYFDWSGNGRGYAPFPDERQYRIALADLASDRILPGVDLTAADLLRAVWTDPASVDPRLKAAAVTREVAQRLSRVADHLENTVELENRGAAGTDLALGIEQTSLFLMRLLFCMFAEDIAADEPDELQLLKRGRFTDFLKTAIDEDDDYWRRGLADLFQKLNTPERDNRYWSYGRAFVRYFNGNLFASARTYAVSAEFRRELWVAAGKDWRKVEPAIFGTLLEQVLTTADRAKLGAHYTPRAYVERLVDATMMEVLRPEWDAVREQARAMVDAPLPLASSGSTAPRAVEPLPGAGATRNWAGGGPVSSTVSPADRPSPNPSREREGERERAIALVTAFHARLADIRVLDPACGTGNFLYVAMEQLLRLEGEVRQFAAGLGAALTPTVHPNQFLGLELNPRAAVIAELVLWIGWLRYRLANTPEEVGGNDGAKPVLPTLTNINFGTHGGYDAVVARTATGEPDAANPRRPEWPEADFIVGNPPFIGKGAAMRENLGDDYLDVLWKANPRVAKSADFVMHWWDRAADILTRPGTRLRRFGFVTTNSITQVFSRRVIEGWLSNSSPERGGGPRSGGGAATGELLGSAPPPPAEEAGGPPPRAGEELGSEAGGHGSKSRDVGRGVPRGRPSLRESADDASAGRAALHLTFAIADHPWTRVTKDAAAVRIAMTVAEAGAGPAGGGGRLVTITSERAIDTDAPELGVAVAHGVINADLSTGTRTTDLKKLSANDGLSSNGFLLAGAGFVVTAEKAKAFLNADGESAKPIIRPYLGGGEVVQRPKNRYIIDFASRSEREARQVASTAYDHLLQTVFEQRKKTASTSSSADARDYFARWWQFAKQRPGFRQAVAALSRYIVTVETSKHRIFTFMDGGVAPDHMVIAIAFDDAFHLGVLSSTFHTEWTLRTGGWLGVGNDSRYSKSRVFDPFPFPDPPLEQRALIAEIAEELDATRRTALAENPSLTMTGLYNLVAAIRGGTLPEQDEAAAVKARARIVAKLHDDLDAAVADAYGWAEDWKRGDLTPAAIVARLVALNAERAAEEAAGQVRWLRPEYQEGRFG